MSDLITHLSIGFLHGTPEDSSASVERGSGGNEAVSWDLPLEPSYPSDTDLQTRQVYRRRYTPQYTCTDPRDTPAVQSVRP